MKHVWLQNILSSKIHMGQRVAFVDHSTFAMSINQWKLQDYGTPATSPLLARTIGSLSPTFFPQTDSDLRECSKHTYRCYIQARQGRRAESSFLRSCGQSRQQGSGSNSNTRTPVGASFFCGLPPAMMSSREEWKINGRGDGAWRIVQGRRGDECTCRISCHS